MKLVFLKKQYLNDSIMKKLGFEKRLYYLGYGYTEKAFDIKKISNPNAKIGIIYSYHDRDADKERGSLGRCFQAIEIYGDNISYRDKCEVDLVHHSGSVDAVMPKFLDMANKGMFEIKNIVNGKRK